MSIKEILKGKKMTIYQLSKISEIPYATCNDIVNGKTRLEKCSVETVYRIALTLGIPMEKLLEQCFDKRSNFENFKSSICHRVKEMGDIDFIIDTLESGQIRQYYDRKWYPECLYLLAMLDYVSRENDIPLCDEYDDIRKCKLDKVIYPAGVLTLAVAVGNDAELKYVANAAIPEFKRFNIIECEVRNVV